MEGKATADMCERGRREGQGRASHTALCGEWYICLPCFDIFFFSNGSCHEMDEEISGMKDRREEGRDPGFL